MSSNLFTPSLRYTNKDTCNSAWTFIDGQNVSDIEVPKFIKNLFTSFDDSRYGKMGKDLIEGVAEGQRCNVVDASNPEGDCTDPNNLCKLSSEPTQPCPSGGQSQDCICVSDESVSGTSGGGGDPCHSVTCGANATCAASGTDYICSCVDGFYGSPTTGRSTTCTPCTPVTNAASVICSEENNSRATCNTGFHVTDNSTSSSSDTCTPVTDDGNITCTIPSSISDRVNSATLPHSATFSSSTGELSSGHTINPLCATGYSGSPILNCNSAGEYQITGCETGPGDPCSNSPCQHGGTCSPTDDGNSHTCDCPRGYTGLNCETEDQTTHTCSSAFQGATTGIDQPCNLSAPDSAGWTKGQLKGDPLWAKFNQATESTTLMEDQSDAIKALITNNSSMDDSGNPEQMNNEVWNACCIKAACNDDPNWNNISLFDTDSGSWTAWAASLGCTFTSSDTSDGS